MELFLSKLRAYKPQPSALRIFIIQFLRECLLRSFFVQKQALQVLYRIKGFWKTPRKTFNCTWKGLHHGCFTGKFPKVFAAATLSKH